MSVTFSLARGPGGSLLILTWEKLLLFPSESLRSYPCCLAWFWELLPQKVTFSSSTWNPMSWKISYSRPLLCKWEICVGCWGNYAWCFPWSSPNISFFLQTSAFPGLGGEKLLPVAETSVKQSRLLNSGYHCCKNESFACPKVYAGLVISCIM